VIKIRNSCQKTKAQLFALKNNFQQLNTHFHYLIFCTVAKKLEKYKSRMHIWLQESDMPADKVVNIQQKMHLVFVTWKLFHGSLQIRLALTHKLFGTVRSRFLHS